MVKNLPASAGDLGSIPDWEKSLEEEMATHFSICQENPMDRGAWWVTVRGVTELDRI